MTRGSYVFFLPPCFPFFPFNFPFSSPFYLILPPFSLIIPPFPLFFSLSLICLIFSMHSFTPWNFFPSFQNLIFFPRKFGGEKVVYLPLRAVCTVVVGLYDLLWGADSCRGRRFQDTYSPKVLQGLPSIYPNH